MSRQREIADRKRSRQEDPGEDDQLEPVAMKRVKRTRFEVLDEDWGQEDEEKDAEEDIVECDDAEDYWLSQTLQVQESKDTSVRRVTSMQGERYEDSSS